MNEVYRTCESLMTTWISYDMLQSDYESKALSYAQEQLKTEDWCIIDSCIEKLNILDRTMERVKPASLAREGLVMLVEALTEKISKNISLDNPDSRLIAESLFELNEAAKKLSGAKQSIAEKNLRSVLNALNDSLQNLLEECIHLGMSVAKKFPANEKENKALKSKVKNSTR